MLAGLWAAKLEQPSVRIKMKQSMISMVQDQMLSFAPRTKKGPDQDLLHKYVNFNMFQRVFGWYSVYYRHVYPWAKESTMMSHDSYSCSQFQEDIKPFPKKRQEGHLNFAGSLALVNLEMFSYLPLTNKTVCPEACRARTDWQHC